MWGPQPFSWASDLGDIRLILAEPGPCHWALPNLAGHSGGYLSLLPWAGSQPEDLSGGDHPNRELASPGVKALVTATHHPCPQV